MKVDQIKDQAMVLFKSKLYKEANDIFLKASQLLDDNLVTFQLFKKELIQLEANNFNNIAFCCGKLQMTDEEVKYSSLVIERALFLNDTAVLVKAYLRRGLAHEQLQAFKSAVDDLSRVIELQPENKQAD
jgi:tetratricopeptide (TPR) repeat protein